MRLDVSAVISRQILPVRIREESPLTAAAPCAFTGSLRASVRFPLRWVAGALVFSAPGPQVAALSCSRSRAVGRLQQPAPCHRFIVLEPNTRLVVKVRSPTGFMSCRWTPLRRWALMSEPIGPYRDHMVSEGLVHKHMWPPITTGSFGTPLEHLNIYQRCHFINWNNANVNLMVTFRFECETKLKGWSLFLNHLFPI